MQQTYNSGGMSPQAEATPRPKKNYCAAVIPTRLAFKYKAWIYQSITHERTHTHTPIARNRHPTTSCLAVAQYFNALCSHNLKSILMHK